MGVLRVCRGLAEELVESMASADVDMEMLLQRFPSVAFERREPEPGMTCCAMLLCAVCAEGWLGSFFRCFWKKVLATEHTKFLSCMHTCNSIHLTFRSTQVNKRLGGPLAPTRHCPAGGL